MKSKRILYIITKSNWGGAQRYVHERALEAHERGHVVAVACGGNGLLAERLRADNITLFRIHSFERDINLKKEVKALIELGRVIRAFHPDVVHVNSSKAGGSGALMARLLGVPTIIFTAHGWPFFEDRNPCIRFFMWFFSYLTVLLAHRTIVVSTHDATRARMWGLTNRIHRIPIGVPDIHFETRENARKTLFDAETREAQKEKVWLVSTGELTHNKNLDVLIEAVAALEEHVRKRVFLTLIGDGELRNALAQKVHASGLGTSVRFLGYVPEARLFLRAFDIFVIPSLKEGLPYGLLEAGRAGLSTIGSNVGGIPEVIIHDTNGMLINPRDPHSLSKAIATLVQRDTLRKSHGDALHARIVRDYTSARTKAETLALYEA